MVSKHTHQRAVRCAHSRPYSPRGTTNASFYAPSMFRLIRITVRNMPSTLVTRACHMFILSASARSSFALLSFHPPASGLVLKFSIRQRKFTLDMLSRVPFIYAVQHAIYRSFPSTVHNHFCCPMHRRYQRYRMLTLPYVVYQVLQSTAHLLITQHAAANTMLACRNCLTTRLGHKLSVTSQHARHMQSAIMQTAITQSPPQQLSPPRHQNSPFVTSTSWVTDTRETCEQTSAT